LKLGSLVKETLANNNIKEQERLTNRPKSETEPSGLGFVCAHQQIKETPTKSYMDLKFIKFQ